MVHAQNVFGYMRVLVPHTVSYFLGGLNRYYMSFKNSDAVLVHIAKKLGVSSIEKLTLVLTERDIDESSSNAIDLVLFKKCSIFVDRK